MVEYALGELFKQDSVDKQIDISFDDVHITNSDFRGQDFELTESLCSESELRFGCCEASVLKFKISNTFEEMCGKWLTVRTILEHNVDNPFQFGKYKVNLDEVSGDKSYRSITAYDAMYDIINAEVAEWYNSLEFPISQKQFRDSFFGYLGISQVPITLIQDDMLIYQTINTTTLSGKDVITSLCELNGVFGHINRNGEFTYVSLQEDTNIYPSIHLFPNNDLFSIYDHGFDRDTLGNGKYISCEYEDFETQTISKLQIRQEKNDIGVIVQLSNSGTNTYIVENNFLVYGKSTDELSIIANALLHKISYIKYRPASISLRGNPCIEVGDGVVCSTKNKEVYTHVLQRTLKGVQGLKDSFISEGVQEYSEKVNSTQRQINQLRGKTNVLERTVEETKSKLSDVESGLSTTITQTVKEIKLEIETTTQNVGDLKGEVNKNTEDIKKTSFEFDTEDLTIKKSGSEMETHISEDGMIVKKSGQDVLIANNKGVQAYDLHAKSYLIIGTNSRFEDYDSGNRTACFWIG